MIWKIVTKWEPQFTDKEIERWYQLKWVSLDDAVSLIKNEETSSDDAKFKQKRELYILEKLLNNYKFIIIHYLKNLLLFSLNSFSIRFQSRVLASQALLVSL